MSCRGDEIGSMRRWGPCKNSYPDATRSLSYNLDYTQYLLAYVWIISTLKLLFFFQNFSQTKLRCWMMQLNTWSYFSCKSRYFRNCNFSSLFFLLMVLHASVCKYIICNFRSVRMSSRMYACIYVCWMDGWIHGDRHVKGFFCHFSKYCYCHQCVNTLHF